MDRIRAALFDHRRPLAAAFAALAVLAAVQAVRPSDPGVPLVVAARDLDSGQVLSAADLAVVSVPEAARPSHPLSRAMAQGRRLAGPVRAGEPITDRRVIEPRALSGYGDDAVLTMVRIDDPAVLAGVRVGDRVDVVATVVDSGDSATVVAADAVVALAPTPSDRSGDAVALGVITERSDALGLAAAGLEARLSVLVTS